MWYAGRELSAFMYGPDFYFCSIVKSSIEYLQLLYIRNDVIKGLFRFSYFKKVTKTIVN